MDKYSLVVDTDSYAGNFERQLTAYVIGAVEEGIERQVENELRLFEEEEGKYDIDFEDLRRFEMDEWLQPMDLIRPPGTDEYNGVEIFLSRKPTDEELKVLVARAVAFESTKPAREWDKRPSILGCRLLKRTEKRTFKQLYVKT